MIIKNNDMVLANSDNILKMEFNNRTQPANITAIMNDSTKIKIYEGTRAECFKIISEIGRAIDNRQPIFNVMEV